MRDRFILIPSFDYSSEALIFESEGIKKPLEDDFKAHTVPFVSKAIKEKLKNQWFVKNERV
ncbi:MAG: hypothetical protein HRT67_06480 [Flavobacteriaceae bacterium]|nr:hypothetical protein [Flavobacteriaceae bacterium]